LLLEVCHAYSRKRCGSVVLGGMVVHLVNRDSSVDYLRLDRFPLDHRLYILVDMMVYMLASDGRSLCACVFGWGRNPFVPELRGLLF
jgi:hypothetical protein